MSHDVADYIYSLYAEYLVSCVWEQEFLVAVLKYDALISPDEFEEIVKYLYPHMDNVTCYKQGY